MLVTVILTSMAIGWIAALWPWYHPFGTDRTGNDVLYQALKSIRTAVVIGSLATIATLPLAIVLGILAGYFKGWVDDLIQYFYTVLSSIPPILLVAAFVLLVNVYIDQNVDAFETGVERAEFRLFLLTLILGVTGWATLCRLLRAETLKIAELEYVQAAHAFGVSHWGVMRRHILPNVMHLVLIVAVLDFSALVLYEAVLSYVGVGVDPELLVVRVDDQPRPQRDVARPRGVVEPRDGVHLHARAGAVRQPGGRRGARSLRSARPRVSPPALPAQGSDVNAPLLRIEQLQTVLDTDDGLVRAVDALSLTIERGETFALVGESGCGKSMTALSILRLLPENGRVAEGRIDLAGTDVTQLPEARMRDVRGRRIGMIFQEPATSLNPVLPVGAQVVEVIERHTPLKGADARARGLDWLRRVGLPDPERRFDNYPFQLSGGQKQRVMIAIALAAEPDVLIADEPTTALDVTVQKQILDLLRDLQQAQGMAMLLITHDLGIVSQVAHRIALMYAGQIVEVAETAEFFARPLHPYARMLLDALPDTAKRGQPLAAIGGTVPQLDQRFDRCRFADRCPAVQADCATDAPPLYLPVDGHAVRCVLYRSGLRRVDLPTRPAAAPGPERALAAPGDAPLLEVRDYRVYFPIRRGLLRRTIGYVQAVDGISFSLRAGRTLALVGESGCGKTTTGKALLQLLRDVAEVSGEARLGRPASRRLAG